MHSAQLCPQRKRIVWHFKTFRPYIAKTCQLHCCMVPAQISRNRRKVRTTIFIKTPSWKCMQVAAAQKNRNYSFFDQHDYSFKTPKYTSENLVISWISHWWFLSRMSTLIRKWLQGSVECFVSSWIKISQVIDESTMRNELPWNSMESHEIVNG